MLTLAESVQYEGYNGLTEGVIEMFRQTSPILATIPMTKIEGDSYTYRTQTQLPSIGWRAVNQTWPESTGTINPTTERLQILGGEVMMDRFIVNTQGKGRMGIDVKAQQYALKSQAAANEYDRCFFEGDDLNDPNEMVGLRRRLTGNQVIQAATNGTALTLALLDQFLDLVPFDNKHLYMNKTLRRKITSLVNAATGTGRIMWTQDEYGRQQMSYAGVPIHVIERQGDASTILDFDETCGTSAVTASMYLCSYGPGRVHGIYNGADGGEKMVDVVDFGELQAAPRHMGRIEAYFGLVVEHGRAAARMRGLTNA